MQLISYCFGLILFIMSCSVPSYENAGHSESLDFNFILQHHSTWSDINSEIILLNSADDATRYSQYVFSVGNIRVDYASNFVLLHFWGSGLAGDVSIERQLNRVERDSNQISLYYTLPIVEDAPDAEVSPLDIIQIEKSSLFTWDDEVDVVIYHNEEEVLRTTVDFSTSHSLFIPVIQADG